MTDGPSGPEGVVHRRSSHTVEETVAAAAPTAALDLPLKILVWADEQGSTWMTYLSAEWLGRRHGIPDHLLGPLGAADGLTGRV